jgi:hypothetical protein
MRSFTVALFFCGCAPNWAPEVSPDELAVRTIDSQLPGNWRLSKYTPEQPLQAAMLHGLQSEPLVVACDHGHVRNVGGSLIFDRKYRYDPPIGDTFKLFITDEHGQIYESWVRFAGRDRIWFQTKTEPWRGLGVLDRVR